MHFEIIGAIEVIETIAVGGHIREIMRLRRQYGLAVGGNSKVLPAFASAMEVSVEQKFIGMRRMESAAER